jgi:hypothetical protein
MPTQLHRESLTTACAWTASVWKRCTDQELLIDLEEGAGAAGREALTRHRCAVTSRLWTLLETFRFPEARQPRLEARLGHLVRTAQVVLDRFLGALAESEPVAPGAVLDFALPLRCRSDAPPVCPLRMHVERGPDGSLFVTLGLREDFAVHPLAALTSERPPLPLLGTPGRGSVTAPVGM